jgi:hypothetical protein
MTMSLIVTCDRPGMHRGGQVNPAAAVYALDHFTDAQLADLFGDPHISVVMGYPLSLASALAEVPLRPTATLAMAQLAELRARLALIARPVHTDATGPVAAAKPVPDPQVPTGAEVEPSQALAALEQPAVVQPGVVQAGVVDPAVARAVRARGRA